VLLKKEKNPMLNSYQHPVATEQSFPSRGSAAYRQAGKTSSALRIEVRLEDNMRTRQAELALHLGTSTSHPSRRHAEPGSASGRIGVSRFINGGPLPAGRQAKEVWDDFPCFTSCAA
jgi:hypothetical protein